ncbi:hypothetical protein ACEZDB_05965 [Streptacidiphilus sp. N1-3]|uniref:Uncharacterized protein n=1 Tax=Streptacidiphilus alkalitolerans TaxID=3342712 RepID=A0ABV6WVY0_9ACTN
MSLDDLAAWRLRPGVAVTLLSDGIHLRGRRSNVTLEGSRALPALWRMLEQALLSGQAPVDSKVRAALGTIVAQLHAHDLLVAADDDTGARRLRAVASAEWRVLAPDPSSPLAQAAGRALARGGATPSYVASGTARAGQIVLTAQQVAVAAGWCGRAAFVTAPGSPEQAGADAAALDARLGPDSAAAPGTALTALIAGAAAQRLLCAVAGSPDPADEGDDQRLLPGRPAVLLATARPLQAEYHCWLGPDLLDPDRAAEVAPPGTLAEALRRVAALGDELVGVLAPALPAALPQLPAALASCGPIVAGGARVDLARLDAMCRAAELRLGTTVGVDPLHAWGRALRQAAMGRPPAAGATVPEEQWRAHPQARHWWSTLTGRLGVQAGLHVVRGSSGFHAAVRDPSGRLLGRAVEATAGDAAAFAALAATAAAQSAGTGTTGRPSGASASIATAGAEFAGWEDDGWTMKWLAGVASRELAFQAALRRLTGLRPVPWRPADADARAVAAGLHGCGFTLLGSTP